MMDLKDYNFCDPIRKSSHYQQPIQEDQSMQTTFLTSTLTKICQLDSPSYKCKM